MANQDRSSGSETGPNPPQEEEVVRLSVTGPDPSVPLESMPVRQKPVRLQPTLAVDLMEEEAEAPVELTPAELGVAWEEPVDGDTAKHTPVGWLVLIGLIVLGLSGWALSKLSRGEEHLEEQVKEVRQGWDEEERREREATELLARVEEAVKAYLLAGDITEKASWVRHRERVIPLMESYYQRHDFNPVRFERITKFLPVGIGGFSFFSIFAEVEGGGQVGLLVEDTREGELRFDWESEVAYQPMEIEDYLKQKPTEPMDFRVYAALDSFYNYEFSDSERYRALLLTFRDSEEFLFGYVEIGSQSERALTYYLRKSQGTIQPVLLRLRWLPETRARRSVLVERLVALRWAHANAPDLLEKP